MTHTDLINTWRAQRSAVAGSRLEDDASLRQLLMARCLQDEAEIAVGTLIRARPADDLSRNLVEHTDPEELRTQLAARRLELCWTFCAAYVAFARQSWNSLSLRARVSLASVALALIAAPLLAVLSAPTDLARGRTWTSSSSQWGSASKGTLHDGDAAYFFHTAEEQGPFVEIDLERTRMIQSVVVTNRKDCCEARALPLVLEASEDRKHWKQLARREQPFTRWNASLNPTPARWLRLSVPRVTWLHLQDVAVY